MDEETGQNRRQFWLGMLLSAAGLLAVFLVIDLDDLVEALRTANYAILILTALGVIAFLLVRAVRWRLLLNGAPPYGRVFHIQNIGYMLTMLLPLRLGDVARAILIGNVPPVTISQGISTMVVERILDMIFMVTVLPFTLAEVGTLPPQFREAARFFGVAAVVGLLILIVAANQRPFARRITRLLVGPLSFIDTETAVRQVDDLLLGLISLTRLRDGLYLTVLSVLVWVPIIFAYHMGMIAVGLTPTIPMSILVVCAAAFSITVPSSPGQIGVFHAGVTFALVEVLDQPGGPALSFAILYHALNTIVLILMGFLGIARTGSTFRQVVDATRAFMRRQNKEKTIQETEKLT
jgi:hypothetical protein